MHLTAAVLFYAQLGSAEHVHAILFFANKQAHRNNVQLIHSKLRTVQGKHYKLHKNRILTIGFRHLVVCVYVFCCKSKYANNTLLRWGSLYSWIFKTTEFHNRMMFSFSKKKNNK